MLLVATLSVAGCGKIRDSRLNPFNWFAKSQPTVQTLDPGYTNVIDNRLAVDQVTALEISKSTGGAIVHAAGLPPTQGWWDAELVAENDGYPVDGVLTYRFLVAAPREPRAASTPQSREVTAADFLSDIKLADIRKIVVLGTANSRSISR